jgi:1-acyl-sn-glycerol-3-phosphate acyltransferase
VSAWLWLSYTAPTPESARWPRYLLANNSLQNWWAHSLKRAAGVIFDLRFYTEGDAALDGPAAIVLPRHTSIGDTVVPIVWYGMVRGFSLRYVLKKELQLDPSLDIVCNRLPNYFVDRFSDDPASEVAGVARLLSNIGPTEGVLIYPEGTRFTPAKREAILARYRERGDDAALARAQNWPNLLPPRVGGALALLAANPGMDLLFIAHTGFEGSARFNDLINGAWAHSNVRIRFWRVAFADVPKDANGQKAFLFAQWDRMATEVARLQRAASESHA